MSVDLTAGIVRILRPNGTTAGTGFIITDDGLIATCSHVVQSEEAQRRGDPRPDSVDVVFHATGDHRQAGVEPDWWRPAEGEDVAILRLEGPLPEGVTPLLLGSCRGTSGHPFKTFGFPAVKDLEGMWGYGTIGDLTTQAGRAVLQLTGTTEVTPGFSGAPVLDTATRRVVGMVTSITVPDRYGRLAETAFITPTETLAALGPALTLCWPAPVQAYLEAVQKYVRDLPYVSLAEENPPPLETVYVRLQTQEQPKPHRERGDFEEAVEPLEHRLPSAPIPAVDALRDHEHLIIVGPPGAGKSTLLRHLTLKLAAGEDAGLRKPHLPLLVSLRGLAEREGDMASRLREQVQAELGFRLSQRLPEEFLETWPSQTGAGWLICLDGLDEIVDMGRLHEVTRQLRDAAWPEARIVITSRPDAAAVPTLEWTTFPRFDLLPFGPQEVQEFARRWFGDDGVGGFLRALETALPSDLRGLPLFLTVAAIVYQRGKMLAENNRPLRRVALYERFVTILLQEDEAPARQMRAQFKQLFPGDMGTRLFGLRREILERLALAMQEKKDPKETVARFLRQNRLVISDLEADKQAEQVIEVLATRRVGLVVRRGSMLDFIHPTFREFLAACALSRQHTGDLDSLWSALEPNLLDNLWANVIPWTLACLDDAAPLVERLLTVDVTTDDEQQRLLFLAARCLLEGLNVEDDRIVSNVFELLGRRFYETYGFQSAKLLVEMESHYGLSLKGLFQQMVSDIGEARLESARVYHQAGLFDRALTAYQEVQRTTSGISTVLAALMAQAEIYKSTGSWERAEKVYREIIRIAEGPAGETTAQIRGIRARALADLANLYDIWGKIWEAQTLYTEAIDGARQYGTRLQLARVLQQYGMNCRYRKALDEALKSFREAAAIASELPDQEARSLQSENITNVGKVYELIGDYQKSLEYFHEALRLQQEQQDEHNQGMTLNKMGVIYMKTGRYLEALRCFNESLELKRSRRDWFGIAITLNQMGKLFHLMGEFDRALNCFNESLEIKRSRLKYDSRGIVLTLMNMSLMYISWGKLQAAEESYKQALGERSSAKLEDPEIDAYLAETAAALSVANGHLSEAIQHYQVALEIYGEEYLRNGARVADQIGALYRELGQFGQAERFHVRAKVLSDMLQAER